MITLFETIQQIEHGEKDNTEKQKLPVLKDYKSKIQLSEKYKVQRHITKKVKINGVSVLIDFAVVKDDKNQILLHPRRIKTLPEKNKKITVKKETNKKEPIKNKKEVKK